MGGTWGGLGRTGIEVDVGGDAWCNEGNGDGTGQRLLIVEQLKLVQVRVPEELGSDGALEPAMVG